MLLLNRKKISRAQNSRSRLLALVFPPVVSRLAVELKGFLLMFGSSQMSSVRTSDTASDPSTG